MLLAVLGAACAGGPPPSAPAPEWSAAQERTAVRLERWLAESPPRRAGALELRLAFAGDVDLDLYVTDPSQETLYYANTPVRSGGELLEDQRCDPDPTDAPRVELARFAAPLPGRYRVGIDYPSACRGKTAVVPYVLFVESDAGGQVLRGLAQRLRFDAIVLEFDLP